MLMLSAFYANDKIKSTMLSVVILNAIMLIVVAPDNALCLQLRLNT
jgi:hypothetical protein